MPYLPKDLKAEANVYLLNIAKIFELANKPGTTESNVELLKKSFLFNITNLKKLIDITTTKEE